LGKFQRKKITKGEKANSNEECRFQTKNIKSKI